MFKLIMKLIAFNCPKLSNLIINQIRFAKVKRIFWVKKLDEFIGLFDLHQTYETAS